MGYLRNRGTKDRPDWYIRFKDVDGKWKQRNSRQPTKDAARQYLVEVEARIARGLIGIPEPTPEERGRKTVTVDELVRRFLGDVENAPSYAPPKIKDLIRYRIDARSVFKARVSPLLGAEPAATVTSADVERLRDALLGRKLAAASVVQTLAILSKLYNWARKAGLIECANPVSGIERPRPTPSLDYLDAAEVGRVLAHLQDIKSIFVVSWNTRALCPMAATAIYCGVRKGELFGLRWTDVHLDAARLDVWRSYTLLPKSGKPRHVPIHPDLAPILRAWRDECPSTKDGLVFPVEAEPGRFRMGAAEDSLGIGEALTQAGAHLPADGKPWHMLRHTFAAHAVMSGASLYAVQKLLGHATPQLTQRYAHLAPSFMAAEVARIAFPRPKDATVDELAEARRKRAAEGATDDTVGHIWAKEGTGDVSVGDALNDNTALELGISSVSPEGVEPSTNGLRVRCSAS